MFADKIFFNAVLLYSVKYSTFGDIDEVNNVVIAEIEDSTDMLLQPTEKNRS